MPHIQNISIKSAQTGDHPNYGSDAVYIQIVDPDMDHYTTAFNFKEVYQFKFLDVEEGDLPYGKITQDQADQLVKILSNAFINGQNVAVSCVVGVCRSGAVAEVGTIMGFSETNAYRQPNLLVKKLMLKSLGLSYEVD